MNIQYVCICGRVAGMDLSPQPSVCINSNNKNYYGLTSVSYRKPGIKNLERRLLKYQLLNKSILLSIFASNFGSRNQKITRAIT